MRSKPTTASTSNSTPPPALNIPSHWKNAYILGNQDVDTSFLTLEMTWSGMWSDLIKEQIGIPVPETFEEIKKGSTINTYVLAAPIHTFVETAANALTAKPDLLNELKANTITSAQDIRNFADTHIDQIDHVDVTTLAQLLLDMRRLQSRCTAYGTVVAWADITGKISQKTLQIIEKRKNLIHPRHWYFHVLGNPETLSLTEQAKADIRQSNLAEDTLLKKYYWLDQGYIGTGLTRAQLQEVKSQQNGTEKIAVTTEDLTSELGLTPDEWRYFEVSRDIIFIKSLRADSRQYLHVVINRIAQNLAKIWNIAPELVTVMSAEEIFEIAIGNKQIPTNLPERLMHSILLPQKNGTYTVLTGQNACTFIEQTLQQEQISESTIIHGQTACQGSVRGKVKLIFGPHHQEKIKEGDIMVSTATSPQLLPAMMRAAAFVTDVGGVTSHAAIVAREMQKPCIIGTKIATKVLKDGDMVEVDANKGIVRIIS